MGAKQFGFGDYEQSTAKKRTRRERFLAEMELVVPWKLLLAAVVSDGEKAASSRQVSDGKMSNSESPLTHRKVFQMLSKRVQVGGTRISVDVTCLRSTRQPVFRRHEPITGLDVERGNLAWGVKEKPQVATTTRANTKTHDRGGSARSSDEGAVMALEQRGCVIPSGSTQQLPLAGGRR